MPPGFISGGSYISKSPHEDGWIKEEFVMVKRTYNNFLTTMSILQNQCGMTEAEAESRTRQIFDGVEYDRQVRKVKSTVEDYLIAEINMAQGGL